MPATSDEFLTDLLTKKKTMLKGQIVRIVWVVVLVVMGAVRTFAQELPLPAVPDTIRQPQERAAYIMLHFWDALDFSDTLRSCSRPFMEQQVVNFLSLLPHAAPDAAACAFDSLYARASAAPCALTLTDDLLRIYLDGEGSPVRSEAGYAMALRAHLRYLCAQGFDITTVSSRLREVTGNAVGTQAPDFAFRTADGALQRLHGLQAPRLLLFFFSADCDHCRQQLEALRASEPLGRAVSEGALQVLAVCLNDEAELQREARDMLPPSWMAAFPLPRFFENPGYSFRHLPLVLLLDEAKRVVGRNPAITDIACMLP